MNLGYLQPICSSGPPVLRVKEQGTKFRYELDRDYNNGRIRVYNLAGELIKEITIPAGKGLNDAPWDCRDSYNKTVEPGLYLYVLECDGNVISRQTMLVR